MSQSGQESTRTSLHLFERIGVELEYMIVDTDKLNVLPITDEVLHDAAGHYDGDFDNGPIGWSNELVLHVIELKTAEPVATLNELPTLFQQNVAKIDALAKARGGRLMPTAMHPWMNPATEAKLWPHDYSVVYEAFDRIFNCSGHGWTNLQSMHINLPFCGDDEFGQLHAAIRALLPILPALAASSPVMESRLTGMLDTRLNVYRNNSRKIPSISGSVVPEPVYTKAEYESVILQRIYKDLASHDPEGILQHEWANARGAIARFDRDAIEIRVLDVQECPQADVAIAAVIVETLKAMCREHWCSHAELKDWPVKPLDGILRDTTTMADTAIIDNADYLQLFGERTEPVTAGQLWRDIANQLFTPAQLAGELLAPLTTIFDHGCLSRRITTALGNEPDDAALHRIYGELCDCLTHGRMFRATV